MRIAACVLIVMLALLLIVPYSLVVIAHRADERAERMYRKWIEESDGVHKEN